MFNTQTFEGDLTQDEISIKIPELKGKINQQQKLDTLDEPISETIVMNLILEKRFDKYD